MKWTVIGVWWESGDIWVEYAEGQNRDQAIRQTLLEAVRDNEWSKESLEDLAIVEIVEGHVDSAGFPGVISASDFLERTDPRRWRPGRRG